MYNSGDVSRSGNSSNGNKLVLLAVVLVVLMVVLIVVLIVILLLVLIVAVEHLL